jgi:hypothetical protein
LERSLVVGQGSQGFIAHRRLDGGAGNRLIFSLDNARLPESNSLKASRETHAGQREIFHDKNDEPPLTGAMLEF